MCSIIQLAGGSSVANPALDTAKFAPAGQNASLIQTSKSKTINFKSTNTRKQILTEMKLMVFIKISFDTLMEVRLSGVPREANIMTQELQSSVLLRLKSKSAPTLHGNGMIHHFERNFGIHFGSK